MDGGLVGTLQIHSRVGGSRYFKYSLDIRFFLSSGFYDIYFTGKTLLQHWLIFTADIAIVCIELCKKKADRYRYSFAGVSESKCGSQTDCREAWGWCYCMGIVFGRCQVGYTLWISCWVKTQGTVHSIRAHLAQSHPKSWTSRPCSYSDVPMLQDSYKERSFVYNWTFNKFRHHSWSAHYCVTRPLGQERSSLVPCFGLLEHSLDCFCDCPCVLKSSFQRSWENIHFSVGSRHSNKRSGIILS